MKTGLTMKLDDEREKKIDDHLTALKEATGYDIPRADVIRRALRLHLKGSKKYHQILEVVREMRRGASYYEACSRVAKKHGVTTATVRDTTSRRLGISAKEFKDIVGDDARRRALIEKLRNN